MDAKNLVWDCPAKWANDKDKAVKPAPAISNFIFFFRPKAKDLKCQLVPNSLKNTKGGKWRTALERYTGQSDGSLRSVKLTRSFASEKLLVPTPNSVPPGANGKFGTNVICDVDRI